EMVKQMEGGLTGIVGVLNFGPGPVLAFRFDMDANELTEANDPKHRPSHEGFSSMNPGASHGCGHDGHTAMGLGVARVLSQIKKHLRGTLKLIFQPAEEGMRGARPMVDAGVADDVDYFLFPHLGLKLRETGVIATTSGILSTTKLDIDRQGVASHPLVSPERGRNALIAASAMALAMHSISPMGEGSGFRVVNVGVLHAGLHQGIVAPNAHLEVATFADSEALNADLVERVLQIIDGTRAMFGVSATVKKMGESFSAHCDPEMVDMVKQVGSQIRSLKRVAPPIPFGATEDATFFMRKVQGRGGKACCVVIGAEISADHHNPFFDFDEKALDGGTRFLASLAGKILSSKG
ncbi:MAG: amidohydrolase, partial [Deltaproteobacteria bacterium]|nr:amidohydrolase [Deltaproteobacteria bacterium]